MFDVTVCSTLYTIVENTSAEKETFNCSPAVRDDLNALFTVRYEHYHPELLSDANG